MADTTPRISPEQAHDHLDSPKTHLVCAYDDEDKSRELHLEGAISLAELKDQVDSIPKEAELIFYCQ